MRPCTLRIASAEDVIRATSLNDLLVEHAPWCRTAPAALPIHTEPLVVAELLAWIARHLVDEPDAVSVETVEQDGTTVLRLHVAPDDVGKVIGRQGRIARALRTLVRASGARDDRRIVLEIAD